MNKDCCHLDENLPRVIGVFFYMLEKSYEVKNLKELQELLRADIIRLHRRNMDCINEFMICDKNGGSNVSSELVQRDLLGVAPQ